MAILTNCICGRISDKWSIYCPFCYKERNFLRGDKMAISEIGLPKTGFVYINVKNEESGEMKKYRLIEVEE